LGGTRAAIRTVIRYRNGVLNGKGASLLDGYMEDLATDRIYRLMIGQRLRHGGAVAISGDDDRGIVHTPELLSKLFDEELQRILGELGTPRFKDPGTPETFTRARQISEAMVRNHEFDPV
jgi:malate synthase